MVIPLFPRVTGFKVESLWRRGSRAVVRCTARLSRGLLAGERVRVEQLAGTDVEQRQVVYECLPQEFEEKYLKLVDTLAGVAVPAVRRAAVGEKKSRAPQKPQRTPPHPRDPAA